MGTDDCWGGGATVFVACAVLGFCLLSWGWYAHQRDGLGDVFRYPPFVLSVVVFGVLSVALMVLP